MLQMVDMTIGRDLDPEVAKLADDIRSAQTPEIEEMTQWLEAWNEPVPETVRDHANAHGGMNMQGDFGMGSDMPGMASPRELKELENGRTSPHSTLPGPSGFPSRPRSTR